MGTGMQAGQSDPGRTPLPYPLPTHTKQTALSAQFFAAITMGLLLALILLLAGALDPLAIPWWLWAGVLLYVAVRQRMEMYSPGSLVRAARDGDVRLVKKFLALDNGRYALELDDKGYSPLMRAAARGSLEIVGGIVPPPPPPPPQIPKLNERSAPTTQKPHR